MISYIARTAGILLLCGCMEQSGFDREMTKMRRQLEMTCMRSLMNEGHQLMYEAEAMTTYCRGIANRRVRLTTANQHASIKH